MDEYLEYYPNYNDDYDFNRYEIKQIIKNDNLEKFKKIKKYKINLVANSPKIYNYVIENASISTNDLIKLIGTNKNNKSNSDKINKTTNLIRILLFYNTYNENDYSRIIAKCMKVNLWEIVDLLHDLGYRTKDNNALINYNSKFRDLNEYYDLPSISKIYNIKNNINIDVNDLTVDIVKEYRSNIISKYSYDVLKKIHQDNLIKFTTKDVITMCNSYNISGLKYLLEIGYRIQSKQFNDLITSKFFHCKYRNRWRMRHKIRNFIKKKPQLIKTSMYESQLIDLFATIKNFKNKITMIESTWLFLFIKKYYKLIEILQQSNYKPKIYLYGLTCILKLIINNDDDDFLKKLLEYNVVKAVDLSTNNKLIDNAVIYKANKVVKFLMENLKMKISSKIFTKYISKKRYDANKIVSFLDFVEFLDKNDFQIKIEELKLACKIGKNYEIIKYLIENKKLKVTSSDLENSLLNYDYKSVNYMVTNGYKLNPKRLIDRLLNKSINRTRKYYYSNNDNMFYLIKYIRNKYKATATNESIKYCIKLSLVKVFDYLVKEFNLSCENIDQNLLIIGDNYYIHNKLTLIQYIIDNSEQLKLTISNNVVENWVQHIIDSYYNIDLSLLDRIINRYNYQLKMEDIFNLLRKGTKLAVKIIMEQNIQITEMIINGILNSKNVEFIQEFKKYNLDVIKSITINNLHNSICNYETIDYFNSRNKMKIFTNYLLKNIEFEITPYTLELFLKYDYYNYLTTDNILILLDKLNYQITRLSYDMIISKKYLEDEKVLNKIQIINYDPIPEEIIENPILIDIENDHEYNDIDDDNYQYDNEMDDNYEYDYDMDNLEDLEEEIYN